MLGSSPVLPPSVQLLAPSAVSSNKISPPSRPIFLTTSWSRSKGRRSISISARAVSARYGREAQAGLAMRTCSAVIVGEREAARVRGPPNVTGRPKASLAAASRGRRYWLRSKVRMNRANANARTPHAIADQPISVRNRIGRGQLYCTSVARSEKRKDCQRQWCHESFSFRPREGSATVLVMGFLARDVSVEFPSEWVTRRSACPTGNVFRRFYAELSERLPRTLILITKRHFLCCNHARCFVPPLNHQDKEAMLVFTSPRPHAEMLIGIDRIHGGNGWNRERTNKPALSQTFLSKTTGDWKDCCNRLWRRSGLSIRDRMISFEPGCFVTSAWRKRFFCPPPSGFEAGSPLPSQQSSGSIMGPSRHCSCRLLRLLSLRRSVPFSRSTIQ